MRLNIQSDLLHIEFEHYQCLLRIAFLTTNKLVILMPTKKFFTVESINRCKRNFSTHNPFLEKIKVHRIRNDSRQKNKCAKIIHAAATAGVGNLNPVPGVGIAIDNVAITAMAMGDIGIGCTGFLMGTLGAGTLASAAGVTTIASVASWVGLSVLAQTPLGWILGAGLIAGPLTYRLSRLIHNWAITEGRKR